MFKERIALPVIVLMLLSGLFCSAWFIVDMHPALEGSFRPALELLTLSGRPTRLPSPFLNRHILLFFTPMCPHCRIVMDHYSRLASSFPFIPVFGISLGSASATDSLARSMRISFPVLVDRNGSVQIHFGLERVPVIMFVDDDDTIRLVLVGSRSFQEDSLLFARFCRSDAPGAADVGSQEGTDISQFPDASPVRWMSEDAPSACFAAGNGICAEPVGPRSSYGMPDSTDGPRQAAGSYTHAFASYHEKEELSCVPRSQG